MRTSIAPTWESPLPTAPMMGPRDGADEVQDYSASDEQLAALIELVKRG